MTAQAAISCTNAQPLALNANSGLKHHLAGGTEVYKIVAPSSGLLSVFSTNNNTIRLSLYNQNCLPVSSNFINDFSGLSVAQGTFYLVVTEYNGASDYQLRVDGDFSTDDRGNSCNNAWVARNVTETGTAGT